MQIINENKEARRKPGHEGMGWGWNREPRKTIPKCKARARNHTSIRRTPSMWAKSTAKLLVCTYGLGAFNFLQTYGKEEGMAPEQCWEQHGKGSSEILSFSLSGNKQPSERETLKPKISSA